MESDGSELRENATRRVSVPAGVRPGTAVFDDQVRTAAERAAVRLMATELITA